MRVKTADKNQGFMKNAQINAYFSQILSIKTNANSKKSAFDQSASVSAVRAKVSLRIANFRQMLRLLLF